MRGTLHNIHRHDSELDHLQRHHRFPGTHEPHRDDIIVQSSGMIDGGLVEPVTGAEQTSDEEEDDEDAKEDVDDENAKKYVGSQTSFNSDTNTVVFRETKWRDGRRYRVRRQVNCTEVDLEGVQTKAVVECKLLKAKQAQLARDQLLEQGPKVTDTETASGDEHIEHQPSTFHQHPFYSLAAKLAE
eukprot:5839661-Pyramimonas_sp.AAC.1